MKTGGMKRVGLAAALGALGACGGGSSNPTGAAPASGLVVVNGDFVSAAVSLLAPDGTLAHDDCIDSGAGGTLSFPLSGDVTTPSQPQLGGDLWLIDRGNSALTILNPVTCAVKGQPSVGLGANLNPRDVSVVTEKKVYVTRYNKNLASSDPAIAGDDIAILDRDSGAITGHIDLSTYAVAQDGAQIQARPDRMLLVDGKVYVTLWNADAKFAATTHGRVAVVDVATDKVTGTIDLPDLKGCEGMQYVSASKTLYVACGGSFSDADQMAGSGVAAIDLGASPPAVAKVTKAEMFGQPVNFLWVAALPDERLFTATMGTFPDMMSNTPGTNDKAFVFDGAADKATALGLEAGALDLGRSAVGEGKLFVPDATFNKSVVHIFDVSGTGAPAELSSLDPDPAKKLPPREIAWY